MIAVWLLRERIAIWLFGDALACDGGRIDRDCNPHWPPLYAQTTLLQGLRKIGDLGRVTVFGAFVGTLAGLAAVWLQGENGLIWFILVQPLAAVLIALHYTRRLPKPTRSTPFAFRDMGSLEAHGQTRRCIHARRACNGGYAVDLCEAISPKNWASTPQDISQQPGASR